MGVCPPALWCGGVGVVVLCHRVGALLPSAIRLVCVSCMTCTTPGGVIVRRLVFLV